MEISTWREEPYATLFMQLLINRLAMWVVFILNDWQSSERPAEDSTAVKGKLPQSKPFRITAQQGSYIVKNLQVKAHTNQRDHLWPVIIFTL